MRLNVNKLNIEIRIYLNLKTNYIHTNGKTTFKSTKESPKKSVPIHLRPPNQERAQGSRLTTTNISLM